MNRPGHAPCTAVSAPQAGVVLLGPTAAGKTEVAHLLAARLKIPILSADSMLVYRGMDIGTAKPSRDEIVRFHYAGVNLAEPDEPFSTGAYLQAVGETIPPADPRPWLVCGGTGLYITRLFRGLDRPAGDPEIRREAESRLAQGGLSSLHAWLNELDPEKRRTLADPLNPRRVIRAIEVALSGSAPDGSSGPDPSPIRVIGLSVPPEQLARRIAVRIRRMLRCGWMDEARTLLARKPPLSQTAAMAIGYRELFETIRGERTIEAAVELMEIRTRQYAKRQMTWFRRQFDVDWVAAGEDRNPAEIAEEVEQRIRDRDPIPLLGLVPKGL